MNRVRSACVRTNSSKTCFVSLSGDLAEAIGLRIQVRVALLIVGLDVGAFCMILITVKLTRFVPRVSNGPGDWI